MIKIKYLLLTVFFIIMPLILSNAEAAQYDLWEWTFNIDGTVTDALLDGAPSSVDGSAFDDWTGLGVFSASVTGAGSHSFLVWLDHDIDDDDNGYENEYGAVNGVPAAGQFWEIDDPDGGDIYDNVTDSGVLDNTNSVPMDDPYDVSMAMGWNFTLADNESALITFTVSDTTVPSGFYLSQTDPDSENSLYFSSTLTTAVAPEPVSSMLFIVGGATLGFRRFRKKFKK